MKIVHLCLDSPYNDDWGYQDNLLPKYHYKLGHDVTVITTNTIQENGKLKKVNCNRYILDNGVKIIRLDYKNVGIYPFKLLNKRFEILPVLEELKPDFIFSHGLLNYSFFQVIDYKKKYTSCIIVQDNHLDDNIGFKVTNFKEWLIREYYRILNKRTQKYVSKVYGVTPWRKKYAENYFKIDPKKTDVLIMGADDEYINLKERFKIRESIRNRYKIKQSDFLIVTGGKIDYNKNIILLMKACKKLPNVKLLIFGNVQNEIEKEFMEILNQSENIIYVGWIKAKNVYNYFFAADLIFFPGQHSVLWEQACASKIPCVFKYWEGMDHVNNGGNADFIVSITLESLTKKINELLFTDKYNYMKKISNSEATDIYLYSNIAKKSLECVK